MFTITVAYFLNSLTCVSVYTPVCLLNKRRDVMKDCDTPFLVRLVATFQDPVSIFYFSCGRLD